VSQIIVIRKVGLKYGTAVSENHPLFTLSKKRISFIFKVEAITVARKSVRWLLADSLFLAFKAGLCYHVIRIAVCAHTAQQEELPLIVVQTGA
jgi:hypothetical protein